MVPWCMIIFPPDFTNVVSLNQRLFVVDQKRMMVFPDDTIFTLEGRQLQNESLLGLYFDFSLSSAGRALHFIGVDDPGYFARLDTKAAIEAAVDAVKRRAALGLEARVQGQLSGPPRATVMTAEKLVLLYPHV